jgi:hypothetical protein
MSYARMGEDSDVYVYQTWGGLTCCYCWLLPEKPLYSTAREMLKHLDEHRATGHKVPDLAYEEIKEDNPDLDKKIEDDE